MRNTRKILVALVVVMAILMSMAALTLTASAEAPEKLYLTPNANWKKDNARFAAYFFGNGEKWVSMTDSDGDGVYEVDVPAGYPSVIFCRMNPNASANNWSNKWNQTADLTVPTDGPNHYTVKENTWDKGGGSWSTYGSTCTHSNLGEAATCTTAQVCLDCGDPVASALGHSYDSAHKCERCGGQASFTVAGTGAHLGTEWDTGNTANDMSYADGVYTKVYENVAAGDYKFKVARDHDWGTAYPAADEAYSVATAGSTVTITFDGANVTVVVAAPCEHNYEQVVGWHPQMVAADCVTVGVDVYICSLCSAVETRETAIDPEAHAFWGDEEILTPVNCATQTNGLKKVACANGCGQFEEQTIYYEYSHDMVVEKDVPATCTEAGEYYAACSICGFVESYSTEAQGHYNWYLTCGQTGTCMAEGCGVEFTVVHTVDPCEGGMCMNCWETIAGAHNYVDGKCSVCEAADPDYVAPANDKLINFSEWEEFAKGTYADGDVYKYNDIFTFIYGKNSRVDGSEKTWDDFSGTLRFSLGGKTNSGVPTKNAIQITVDGAHTLKIWYVAGGDGRYFELRDADGAALSSTTTETVKNTQYYAELELPAAGTYYLTIPADNNYIFQLELVAKASEPETPHVNTLVVGDTNKIVVTGNTVNQYDLPIEWVTFVVDEAAHYSFVGDNGALAYIFDLEGNLLCGGTGAANLEVGYYAICLGNGLIGEFNVAVTKSEWVQPPVEEPELPALVLGDNTVVIDGSVTNLTGNAIAWLELVITEAGTYKVSSADLNCYIYSEMNLADLSACLCGFSGTATLEPGTYYVCAGKEGVTGEFTVTLESLDAPVHKNAIVLGDNHYIVSEELLAAKAEWLAVYLEPGTYVINGCDPLVVYVFYASPDATLTGTEAFVWNVDNATYELLSSLEFTVATAGYYWVGINFDYIGEQREFDFTLAVKPEEPEHEHNYVDGKCECGESDPNYVPPVDDPVIPDEPTTPVEPETPVEEAPKLNFFQRIWQAILNFFKNLFGKKD